MIESLKTAVDHPIRKRTVQLLVERGSLTTAQVAESLGLELTSAGHHLKVLTSVSVVNEAPGEKGQRIYTENLAECPPWVRDAIGGTGDAGT